MKAFVRLGPRQAETLELLEEKGECTTGELAELLDSSPHRTRDVVKRLRERGLVESRPDPNPARPNGKLHSLTEDDDE